MGIKSIKLDESPPLFADYLKSQKSINPFYRFNYKDDWQNAIDSRIISDLPRKQTAKILYTDNIKWEASRLTIDNIKKLEERNTFAVLTGQQAGVLGGPLYTFYKIMTVLKLTAQLTRQFPKYHFTPIFWMEVNDSDFDEISAIKYLNKENKLCQLKLEENPNDAGKTVAARLIDNQIQQWRTVLEEDFFDTEFKQASLELFLDSYTPQKNFTDAFAEILTKIFGKYGLILLNPANPSFAPLFQPILIKGLKNAQALYNCLWEVSESLKLAGYTPQIKLRPGQTLTFYQDSQNRRVRVDFDEKNFLLKYPEGIKVLPQDDLIKELKERPNCLTPNVALRPLIQDSLFSTIAYVGGPSEVAYYAQLASLYQYLKISMPVIYPRHRVTIVERKIQKNVRKFGWEYQDLLNYRSDLLQRFMEKNADQGLNKVIETTQSQITEALKTLAGSVESIDPTLARPLEKTRQNIESSFKNFAGKIMRSLEEKHQVQLRQIEQLLLNLLPRNNYQEREFNMLYFCIKYGLNFIDEIYHDLPEDAELHHIIEL